MALECELHYRSLQKKREKMEKKKLNFIIKLFGCYTTIDGDHVLTSLANASRVSVEEFWSVFSGDAGKYFEILPTEDKKELSVNLDDGIIRVVEQELELS